MKERHPFLWEIKWPEGRPSYILGTMHISEGSDIPQLGLIKEKIEECDIFANEMNLSHRHLMDAQSFHLEKPLHSFMDQRHYAKMRKSILKSFEIDIDQVGMLKPLITSNMIAEVVLGKQGCIGLDQYLYNYAKSLEKPLTGVEKVEEQAEIMEKIPLEYQIKALRDIGKKPKSFRRSVLKMNALYQRGDLKGLHQKAKKSLGKLRRLLLWERNFLMADRIANMIADTSVFIAIGAGHLAGSKGVIPLLKKKGVQVKRISAS